MGHFVASMYLSIYDSMYSLSGIKGILTTYSDAISDTLADGGPMHSVYLQLRIIALGMLAVYFIISFGTRMIGRETSPAVLFKTLLQYFVGFCLAMFSFEIVKLLFQLGDGLMDLLAAQSHTATSLEKYTVAFEESVKDIGLIKEVFYLFKGLIPYVACLITDIAIVYVVVTRVLRICVCAAASPIAIANVFEGSRRSDGVRFIKKTLSMSLQCSVIMLVVLAITDVAGYMTASDKVYSDDTESTITTVTNAKKDMIESSKQNKSKLKKDVADAVDDLGYSAYDMTNASTTSMGIALKPEIADAKRKLSNPKEVDKNKEKEYKEYEKKLGIQIFKRDTKNKNKYVYSSKSGYAVVANKYMVFDKDETIAFMDALLGGPKLIYFVLLCTIKIGLIKQSTSLCNTIVGV